jgi:hypothetical protein
MAKKSKSMTGGDGDRKLATGSGRTKQKSGGEAQKESVVPRGSAKRNGSSKQCKG